MDIPSFITSYGGPGGIVAVIVWLYSSERRHNVERRDELRKDIEREQADNDRLRASLKSKRAALAEKDVELGKRNARIAELEDLVCRLRNGEDV